MSDLQQTQISFLDFDEPATVAAPRTPPRPRTQRRTSKGIAPGDVVEVDRKGRRFHALVISLDQRDSGRFELELRPLDSRISYRSATVRDVIGLWRRAELPPRGGD